MGVRAKDMSSLMLLVIPSNVDTVLVIDRSETEITLQWKNVNNRNDYRYELRYLNEEISAITPSPDNSIVEQNVKNLSPGTEYSFMLYTVFENVMSSGYNFSNVTIPSNVDSVLVIDRSETEITLQWKKVNNRNDYTYELRNRNGEISSITQSQDNSTVEQNVKNLSPGTEYSFMLHTVFENVMSSGYNFSNVTMPSNVRNVIVLHKNDTDLTFQWDVVSNIDNNTYIYILEYGNGLVNYINHTAEENKVTHHISSLIPGTNYSFTLYTEFADLRSTGYTFFQKMTLNCASFNWTVTNSTIEAKVNGCTHVTAKSSTGSIKNGLVQGNKVNLQDMDPGEIYTVSLFYELESDRLPQCSHQLRLFPNSVSNLRCEYYSGGYGLVVIWDRLHGVVDVVQVGVNKKNFNQSQNLEPEQKDLSSVGIEQSTAAARLPENKDKNRFSNVLAYDTSRVHLITKNESDSDYINANYMPGYGNAKRQYIASQGPLPSTVSDFWRMVWEQKSQGIVMVTNCTESGRVKCEQYWPLDYTPCLYGNLLVTVKSEDKYPSWTLREFNVKNKTTSETRTVKHFHFTAWPDHGVPTGTEELIQFRGLVRQHIEKAFSAGPTVVHCSAGVGRTGTLIALDVLLQQLDKKKEVGIAAFVQQMRLNRPLMVQTESQYVFLHQCIMDTLQPKVMPDSEPLYENSEMIYVNAMAIREFEKGK
ncbi:receptor-type tyrosine- phosphatase H-like protein [Labeo rohita]|uniref:protein-tyrosine-phosphatase n=1 Tax=Labeo rohita TaxID=84645 RepID=A0A498NCN3_LABRO|nr:receptor-type tyrosine- phosphatase H-like protein [Labeo rohita]